MPLFTPWTLNKNIINKPECFSERLVLVLVLVLVLEDLVIIL